MNALRGVKVVELCGVAPVPFCGQILADFGADVTLINKVTSSFSAGFTRNKKIIQLDYESDIAKIRDLINEADVLLDPYRPGILEAMGLDPSILFDSNPRLIVCRISGYGQTGEMRMKAGHDLNFLALSGILPLITNANNRPWPPANILSDFAAGSLSGAFGILAALAERERTGRGGVVDASITDAVTYLSSFLFAHKENKLIWDEQIGCFKGNNPHYRIYSTKDNKFIAVGALEPKYQIMVMKTLGIDVSLITKFKKLTAIMEEKFKKKTREEWTQIFNNIDACVTPVLDIDEVQNNSLQRSRGIFKDGDALPQPSPRIYPSTIYAKISSKL
ncbi:unnamed protein product [Bursaphelenchus xylophilus]|uniref:(pine wood nematode) hypothetical protein n=1 Tax=Bursaphelenchus xylophilus TaxID=6326 RepID=A0A1I7SB62_BURXY|nr:unnamed protein product [Bursaphelenchus xylophilus]CAG9118727.1 unnamed protein product [Bursaphelenchus xylophilus]